MTFPSHTSMITGVNPAQHGIYANNLFNPYTQNSNYHYFYKDIKVPTIFDRAIKKNMRIVGVDWPVTVGAPFDDIYPGNDAFPATIDEAKFILATMKGPYQSVVRSYRDLLGVTDDQRAKLAVEFIRATDPHLAAIHLNDLDEREHESGKFSDESIAELERSDAYLGQIMQAAADAGHGEDATWIIVSDHGFFNTTGSQIAVGTMLAELGLTEAGHGQDWQAYPLAAGGLTAIYVNPNVPASVAGQVNDVIETLAKKKEQYHIQRVYPAPQVEKLGMFPGAYVVLEAEDGFTMSGALTGGLIRQGGATGHHGWSPHHKEMHASFIMAGPGIKQGVEIGMVDLRDVAATIDYLLELGMPEGQGGVITEAFA